MKNIVLIGFMGAGKTTIATAVARRLGMRYVSSDDVIVDRQKRTINEIFTRDGEDYFRTVESDVIRELAGMENLVIDTGGGVVLRPENMANLKSNGIVICVSASPETVIERTKKYKHRPLLNVPDPKAKVRELLATRAPLYAQADHTIDTDRCTIRQAVDTIVAIAEATSQRRNAPEAP